MDDAPFVRRVERLRDLPGDRERLALRDRAALETAGEVLAFDELHREHVCGLAGRRRRLLEAVDVGDVGMVERGEQLRFPLEAGEPVGIARDGRGQQLEGDRALEPRVARPVHLAHAPRAEESFDRVRPEANAGGEAHREAPKQGETGAILQEPGRAPTGVQAEPLVVAPAGRGGYPRSFNDRESERMSDRNQSILVSGGHKGAEAEFGRAAEKWGVRQVTLSYDGHVMEYSKNVEVLSPAELLKGDVSMEIVSKRMGRTYTEVEQVRTVCQLIFHMVSRSYLVFAVGWIQGDDTVQGGTGWGVELAKFFNRPVSVFDQARHGWFTWKDGHWVTDSPVIPERPFAATGTRNLNDESRKAIAALFERSFGPAK